MNSDLIDTMVTKVVASLLAGVAGATGATGDQNVAIATGAGALATVLYGLYRNWRMRKVPEKAVVTAIAPTVAEAKASSIPAAK